MLTAELLRPDVRELVVRRRDTIVPESLAAVLDGLRAAQLHVVKGTEGRRRLEREALKVETEILWGV